MTYSTLEGLVENGQIRISGNVVLPENAKVYVLIADPNDQSTARVFSPRLAHPEQAIDFVKEVTKVSSDAGL
jgi:hypothetical protein